MLGQSTKGKEEGVKTRSRVVSERESEWVMLGSCRGEDERIVCRQRGSAERKREGKRRSAHSGRRERRLWWGLSCRRWEN